MLRNIRPETVSRTDPASKLITQKEITISGSKGLELNIQFSLNETKVDSKTIYVHKGNTVYEIVRSLTDNTKQDTRDKFDLRSGQSIFINVTDMNKQKLEAAIDGILHRIHI